MNKIAVCFIVVLLSFGVSAQSISDSIRYNYLPQDGVELLFKKTNLIEGIFLGKYRGSIMIQDENVPSFFDGISDKQVVIKSHYPPFMDVNFLEGGNTLMLGTIYFNGEKGYIIFEYNNEKYGQMLSQAGVNFYRNMIDNSQRVPSQHNHVHDPNVPHDH